MVYPRRLDIVRVTFFNLVSTLRAICWILKDLTSSTQSVRP